MDEYLKRRIWDKESGVSYFCTICGEYKPEDQFYKNKNRTWGVETKCKEHFTKKKQDSEDDHIRFTRLYDGDYSGARQVLKGLGYDLSQNIHEQFKKKYNLK